jgi:hypothetical protein
VLHSLRIYNRCARGYVVLWLLDVSCSLSCIVVFSVLYFEVEVGKTGTTPQCPGGCFFGIGHSDGCAGGYADSLVELHRESAHSVEMSSFEEVVVPPQGIVSLKDKQVPVCERPAPYDESYAYTRGVIDISAWKAKLKSLPAEMWEDENQEGNVKMTRPAHDAWGIKKIIFQFCDDFLMKVLDLPWSQKPEWKELLTSVYSAIGIDESKVVRSLLASIPPGVSIPTHHDTGYWVKHTHRCHLAIETGKDVEFKVGPTPELMKKVHKYSLHVMEACRLQHGSFILALFYPFVGAFFVVLI